MNDQLQESIALAVKRAFDAGRRYENNLVWQAIDRASTGNEIGDFVYLDDLKFELQEENQPTEGIYKW